MESSPDLVDAFPVADPPQHDVPVERLPLGAAAAAFGVRLEVEATGDRASAGRKLVLVTITGC